MIGSHVIHKPWTFPGEVKELMFGTVIAQSGKKWIIQWDGLGEGCTEHTTKEVEGKIRNYEKWSKKNFPKE